MKVIASASSKGGTGKTTVAVHLATGFALKKKRVLLVDIDPQGSASAWLLGAGVTPAKGTFDVLRERKVDPEWVVHLERQGLDFLPATPDLRQADLLLAGNPADGWSALRDALEQEDRWDLAVIDCPPNLNMGTMNAICASTGVVAPLLSGSLSLVGLDELERSVVQLRKALRVKAKMLGCVLFAADNRESVTEELRQELKGKLFESEVRISTAAKTLSGSGETAWDEGVDPRGREDYRALLSEAMGRLGVSS